MHPWRRATAIVAAMAAATGFGMSSALAAPTRQADPQPGGWTLPRAVPAAGTFYPTAVSRLLGSPETGYAVEPGTPVTVTAAGRGGLPSSGVSAVVVNVVAVAGAADAALSLGPGGVATGAPLLVAPTGTSRSALLTLPLAAGAIQLTSSASAGVSVDLVGFYAADDTVLGSQGVSGGYQPVDVTRVFDTDAAQPLAAGARQVVDVDLGTAASPHTTALLIRATAKGAAAAGTLTVGSSGAADVGVPAVPFVAGTPSSNLAVVPATTGGRLAVAVTNASGGATGVTLDLVGFYDDGALGPNLRFRPLPQTRVVDTATGLGTTVLQPGRRVTATPGEAVVGDSTFALVGVATATPAGGPSGLDVDTPDATPATDVDVDVGTGTTSVAVQPEVGSARGLGLQARSTGAATDVRVDVTGSFEAYPPVTNPAARGWVPAVSGWQVSATAR